MNIFKKLFKILEPDEIINTKRFEFGKKFNFGTGIGEKEYRYLYTQGDDDIFFCEETIQILLINKDNVK